MAYRECLPDSDLIDVVECFWSAEHTPAVPQRILPDGCMDLLWEKTRGSTTVTVVGTMSRAHLVTPEPDARLWGVRFRPGWLPRLLDVDARTLLDERADASPFTEGLRAQPFEEPDRQDVPGQEASRAVGQWIRSRLRAAPGPDRLSRRALGALTSHRHPAPVRSVADQLGMSERTLERRCRSLVGVGPKHFHRVMRLRRALESLWGGQRDIGRIAVSAGYADHAHFCRDTQALCGVTPTDLVARAE